MKGSLMSGLLSSTATMVGLAVGCVSLPASAQVQQPTAPVTTPAPIPGDGADQQVAPLDQAPTDQATQGETSPADIVVTGTLLRGIAPVGTNVIGLNRADIKATGVTSTQQLLATIPQITSAFNSTPAPGSGDSGVTTVRPNIRNLASNGGNTTLVLLDGHNLVGAGITLTTPDIGFIPPGALERVDVVPDGGSSLYGSDAIGGIVNLITRKNMNGVELAGHLGTADRYLTGDVNVTAGRTWSTGSALVSYAYRANTNILGQDRDYYRRDLRPLGGIDGRSTACDPGTITANGTTYALPNRVPGTVNRCDPSLQGDVFPAERQHNVFGSLEQRLGDRATFSLTGFYTDRKTTIGAGQRASSGRVITSANPFFQSIDGEQRQSVAYRYTSAAGPRTYSITDIQAYQLTPQIKYDIGSNWNVTLLGNFGRSVTTARSPGINDAAEQAALAGTTLATALNPYDPAATNPAVIASILGFEQYARNRQTLAEGRGVIDGTLLTLPGGDVRLAVGGQYQYTQSKAVQVDAPIGDLSNAVHATASRDVYATFAELLVPVFGTGNAIPGIQSLLLDASVRYDHYSDFGGTTNPKVGVTYKPFRALTIRGNYGTSFNAPSLADKSGAVDTRAIVQGTSDNQLVYNPADVSRPSILLAGGNPNLTPQTANTYSIGADFKPAFAKGLTLSATYYNVSLKNVILVTPVFDSTVYTNPALKPYYTLNPTLSQALAIIGNQRIQGPSIESLYAGGTLIYGIYDARRNNLGTLKVDGIDFNAAYETDTSIGTLNASVGGTLTLDRKSTVAESPEFNELRNSGISPLQLVAALGDRIGALTAQARVNYSAGYRYPGLVNQTRVGGFAPINLFFAYDLPDNGNFHGGQISINLDNLLDDRPPFINRGNGYANGSTFGRLLNIGFSMKL